MLLLLEPCLPDCGERLSPKTKPVSGDSLSYMFESCKPEPSGVMSCEHLFSVVLELGLRAEQSFCYLGGIGLALWWL